MTHFIVVKAAALISKHKAVAQLHNEPNVQVCDGALKAPQAATKAQSFYCCRRPKKITTYIFTLFILATTTTLKAQTPEYIHEYEKGYRGGYIKGLESVPNALQFAVIGDWGRGGLYFGKQVADQLSKAVTGIGADFIISTGDNIYPSGVASVTDPLWNLAFENVFYQYPLWRKWYVVLGNHDYGGNPQAQIDYSKVSGRWVMPASYYSIKKDIGGGQYALFIFLDTNPFNPDYYTDEDYGPKIVKQDTAAQKQWLVNLLSDTSSNIKWKIAVGHHPLYTAGTRAMDVPPVRNSLEAIFEKYKLDIYISGHEHHLQSYHPKNKYTHYFISGAGSEADTTLKPRGPVDFFAAIQGFMTFSVTPQKVLMQTINRDGKLLTKETILK